MVASLCRRTIDVRTHPVSAIEGRPAAQRFSRRAAKNILLGVVWKSAAHKRRAATERIAFRRFPAVLPGTVKIHPVRSGLLHPAMIGVIPFGTDLLCRTA